MSIRFVPRERTGWVRFALFAVAYTVITILLVALASWFDLPNDYAPWYPPAAAMLAYLMVTGWRGLPVAIAARILAHAVARTDQLTNDPWLVIGQAIAVSVSYFIAAEILDRIGLLHARIREFGSFIVVGVVVGPLMAATSSATIAAALGVAPWSDVPSIINTFWVGDAVAIASIVPFLVFALNALRHHLRMPVPASLAVRIEFALQGLAIVLLPVALFALDSSGTIAPYLFLAVIPVAWMALRRDLLVATAGLLVTNTLVAIGARYKLGADTDLLQVQMVMLAAAIAALYCAAVRRTYLLQQFELTEREERYRSLVDHSPDFITRVSGDEVVFAHVPAEGDVVRDQVIATVRLVAASLPPQPDAVVSREWHTSTPTGDRWFDARVVQERRIQPDDPTTYLGVTTDRTGIHHAREQLRARARHDRTTGLFNRVGFEEELARFVAESRRACVDGVDDSIDGVELVVIRLSDLPAIEATHGSAVAEMALVEGVARLVGTAGAGDLVGRLGPTLLAVARQARSRPQPGANGTSVVGGKRASGAGTHNGREIGRDGSSGDDGHGDRTDRSDHRSGLGTRARAALDEAVDAPSGALYLNPQVGVRRHRFGEIGDTLEREPTAAELLSDSLIAADAAGVAMAGDHVVYDPTLRDLARTRHETIAGIRQGIDRDEFFLHFQPVIDLNLGAIAGAEALVRWNHPIEGIVLPERFIGLAERTGLIEPLGRLVVDLALVQLERWQHQFREAPFALAVNVSARQLVDHRFANYLMAQIAATEVTPDRLHIEVTETATLDNIADTKAVVGELHDLGVHFSLDDFGTGYAAMSSLRDLPIDTIKIDQSFTQALPEPDALTLVKVSLSVAEELGLRVIAEGVETEDQQRILLDLGCHLAQGWLYAPALPSEELTTRLTAEHPWSPAG